MTDRRGFLLRLAGAIGLATLASRCVGPDVTPLAATEHWTVLFKRETDFATAPSGGSYVLPENPDAFDIEVMQRRRRKRS